MNIKVVVSVLLIMLTSKAIAWEPSQAMVDKAYLDISLFPPYGRVTVEMAVDGKGLLSSLIIETDISYIDIPSDQLSSFEFPSLADVEVMHYGELNEGVGIGGSFSVCIPYGKLKTVGGADHWQRAVIEILVTENGEKIIDIPHPDDGPLRLGVNGCEVAALEVYGF